MKIIDYKHVLLDVRSLIIKANKNVQIFTDSWTTVPR